MELKYLIALFLVMMFVVCGIVIAVLRWVLFSSTESSVKRLDDEIEVARQKQLDLNIKIKDAEEELQTRRNEAKELVDRMRGETEESTKEDREKIIKEAREEGENIISKAQDATKKMRLELEKEMDLRAVGFGMEILNKILTDKAKGQLSDVLVEEFMESLKNVDMGNIGPEIKEVELITPTAIDEALKGKFAEIIKGRLNRTVGIKVTTDPSIGGGAVVKFGNLALDGSIKNLIREEGIALRGELDSKKV